MAFKFLSIGNRLHNIDSINTIECNDDKCVVRGYKITDYYLFYKNRDPVEYQDTRKYWLTLKTIQQQHILNVPTQQLEQEAKSTEVLVNGVDATTWRYHKMLFGVA